MKHQKERRWSKLLVPLIVTSLSSAILLSCNAPPLNAPTTEKTNSTVQAEPVETGWLQDAFVSAAKEFGVPESILLSVSYNLSRWEQHRGQPSASAGYGLMHLLDVDTLKGLERKRSVKAQATIKSYVNDPNLHTLETAAKLLKQDPKVLKLDPVQNIRGAAALLAQYAKDTVGRVPTNINDWYGAVAKYSGSKKSAAALGFADQVYLTIQQGVERKTTDGHYLRLAPQSVKPNRETAKALRLQNTGQTSADCPSELHCQFIAAAHTQLSPDPTDYSSYDISNRPTSGPDIRYIVIHSTGMNYAGMIDLLANPATQAAAHYVMRSSDGDVTQMVHHKDIAWQAGNWYFNMHSIGIEHEGYPMEGATWFSEQQYRSSAKLVRYLAHKYQIPLNRAHIIGHDEIPGLAPARQTTMHEDPGPFWDWEHYMELLGAPISPEKGDKKIVTLKPHFQTNKQPFDDTSTQPANFVYLYQSPDFDAPLLDDPAVRGPGTRKVLEWGDKAPTGRTFYLADQQGDWAAIWFGGQKAWFHNPKGKYTISGNGVLITPKAGKASISVYGSAYPEASAYPADIPPPPITPLQYKISAGQIYVAAEKVKSNYYYATTFTTDPSTTHRMISGQDEYYRIHFNHRYAFVKASDVDVVAQ